MEILQQPPPEGLSIGPLFIHYYSLTMLAAFLVGYFLLRRQAKSSDIPLTTLTDAAILTIVAGIIGGRLGYVVQNLSYFSTSPADILRLTTGGLSIHGAVFAGLLALAYYARRKELSLLSLTDLFTLPLIAGQIIGRLGNYFNQELFGYPTNLPWKIFIDPNHRPGQFSESAYFHPTFLYEMVLNGIGFLILSRVPIKKEGYRTFGYLLVFGMSRFITEIFRISDRFVFDLSLAQLVSLILLTVAVGVLLLERSNIK